MKSYSCSYKIFENIKYSDGDQLYQIIILNLIHIDDSSFRKMIGNSIAKKVDSIFFHIIL